MKFTVVFSQVLILFIILIIGFISRKFKILNVETNKSLTEFLVNVTIPFTIISSFNQKYPHSAMLNAGKIFLLSFLIHGISIIIGKIVTKNFKPTTKNVLWFVIIFSNCGFMGFPIMESIYGKIGIFYSSIYIIPFNLFLWTIGQIIFSETKDKKMMKKAILNPGIIAVFLGLIIFIIPYDMPFVATNVFELMGSLTSPLSMIIIGSMLASINVKDIFSDISVYYGSVIRLFLMPFIFLILFKIIGISGIVLGVCIISTAMPAAANTVIFSEKFGGDSLLASKIVFLSTAISIITIPIYLIIL
ncbi:MAG: AEC family transporter [Clostridiales bacterium]